MHYASSHQDQLVVILVGLREYIPEQKKLAIEQAFATLKNETEFEETVNQIHLALYTLQDAVSVVDIYLLIYYFFRFN